MKTDAAKLEALGIKALELMTMPAFGVRTKKEWELELLHAALAEGLLPSDAATLAVRLRVSIRKARALLDELDMRFAVRDGAAMDKLLRDEVIAPAISAARLKPGRAGGRIDIQIDRMLLRERFRELVRDQYGVVDRGLDGTILNVDIEVFLAVLAGVSGIDRDVLAKQWPDTRVDNEVSKPLGRLFAERFVAKSGELTAEKVFEWGEILVTGGAGKALKWLSRL